MGVLLCHTARRFDGIRVSLKIAVVLAFTVKLVGCIMCAVLSYVYQFLLFCFQQVSANVLHYVTWQDGIGQ